MSRPSSSTDASTASMSRSSFVLSEEEANSPLAGLAGAPIHQFTGIADLRRRVRSQSGALQDGRTNEQYLAFIGVNEDDLARIDSERERPSIGKNIRLTHYTDSNWLIIKLMPTGKHETAHVELGDLLRVTIRAMGITRREWIGTGSQTYRLGRVSKEADGSFTNPLIRQNEADWPTIIFESGVSERLSRPRVDADLWLRHSGGDVKIVILISINRTLKTLLLEKWCMAPPAATGPRTRAVTRNPMVPTRMQQITVTPNPTQPVTYTIVGAPLILGFQDLFLRMPIPPETNVVLNAAILHEWAETVWSRR